ncbi:hypothetical protein PtrM4_074160 [Pyrenophora tritici-repentis]|uniref:Chromo domain-containing protein n=1 Tax=Pyrenophora tritici-repentis TaxID=45151 RepID=A0A834VPW4_9PLEO|nr:hypothetical protein PtrM4_074160 [Pyrenophora tritici-repentis]
MNSTWETYMKAFVNWAQDNWAPLCPLAQIAIKGRDATTTKVSPFFLQHGYNIDPLQLEIPIGADRRRYNAHEKSDREKAESIVTKLRELLEMAQASMAQAQQEQERQANGNRREAPQLRVGDKVWVQLGKQFATGRRSKKLDWRSAKYTVIEVIDTHTVRLNTPPGPHNVFHVDRLRLASSDPLPSQSRDDDQPLPIQVDTDGADMWEVEDILAEICRRRGRGMKWWYEVKWKGYHLPTMEPKENLENTEAKIRWEQFTEPYRDPRTRLLPAGFRRGSNEIHPDAREREEGGNVTG